MLKGFSKDAWKRIAVFAVLAALYIAAFAAVSRTPFYDVTGAHNDRLFSSDDVYYVTEFFSDTMDDSPRVIKHPLLIVFGCVFTKAERLLLGEISWKHHYQLIVLTQMVCSLLSAVFLDRILEKQYGMKTWRALLMCAVYSLSFSTVFYTFVAESYIGSSLILIMTFYFARERRSAVTAVLGVMAAGITITNAVLWAIIVLACGGVKKRTVLTLAGAGAAFCAVTAALPIRGAFFGSIISGGINSARNFTDSFSFAETLRRIFFVFFGSTSFYLDTADASPFGEFRGDALSFLPSASAAVIAAAAVWLAFIVYAAVRYRREKLLYAPLAVLAANLVLHGAVGYGLKEGFLYSLHHLPAQLLIAALPLACGERERRWETAVLGAYLVCIIVLNVPGWRELATFMMR